MLRASTHPTLLLLLLLLLVVLRMLGVLISVWSRGGSVDGV